MGKRLTVKQVREEVEAIRQADDETAHMREDELYRRILGIVASGRRPEECVALARAALVSQRHAFARNCA